MSDKIRRFGTRIKKRISFRKSHPATDCDKNEETAATEEPEIEAIVGGTEQTEESEDSLLGLSTAETKAPNQEMGEIIECQPLRTIQELFEFEPSSIKWAHLVTRLVPRAAPRLLGENYGVLGFGKASCESIFPDDGGRRKVLVCHDFKGNYLNDRFVNNLADSFDDYRFYNWAGIDYFCYFSHQFVTIPPYQWINAAHKNGVKVLGTFIVEFDPGTRVIETLLESQESVNRTVEKLIQITKTCRFEGWLLNIESRVKPELVPNLMEFVRLLTWEMCRRIPNGFVIWYDSVTKAGSLVWQNELNTNNQCYFQECQGIMLNYNWNDRSIDSTENTLEANAKGRKHDVYFGIDVFGRGQLAKMDTHKTMARIVEKDFSAGIFAPGWTYESLSRGPNINEDFLRQNDLFYASFWKYLYTSGFKDLPFYSSFCMGSGRTKWKSGLIISQQPWFDLAEQQPQISVPLYYHFITHDFSESFEGGSCIKIFGKSESKPLRLFCCDFKCDNDLVFAIAMKTSSITIDLELILFLFNPETNKRCRVVLGSDMFIKGSKATWDGHCGISNLQDEDLGMVQIFLEDANEKHLPPYSFVNDWQIRYYYLTFEDAVKSAKCLDIGIRIRGRTLENEWAKLGAISVHEGPIKQLKTDSPLIKESDFIEPR